MTIDPTITSQAIAALTACLLTAFLTQPDIIAKNYSMNERNRLDGMLNQIIAFSITYPYLEDEKFIAAWLKQRNSGDEKYLRYEAYCIYNFNFLDQLARFYKFKKEKVEDFVHIQEIVRMHAEWWRHPTGEYDNIEDIQRISETS